MPVSFEVVGFFTGKRPVNSVLSNLKKATVAVRLLLGYEASIANLKKATVAEMFRRSL